MKLKQNEIAGLENCLAFGPGFVAECRGVGEFRHIQGTSEGRAYDISSVKLQLETGDGVNVRVLEAEVRSGSGETLEDFQKAMKDVKRGVLVYVGIDSGMAFKKGKDGKDRAEQVFRSSYCVPLATPAA